MITDLPTVLSSLLVGPIVNGVSPTPTLVNNVPIASILELQSKSSSLGAFTLPRMTNAEMLALTPAINGMQVFNSDVIPGGAIYVYQNNAWVGATAGAASKVVTFTQQQILSLRSSTIVGNPVSSLPILAAAPTNCAYVILDATIAYVYGGVAFALTNNPSTLVISYGPTVAGPGPAQACPSFNASLVEGAVSAFRHTPNTLAQAIGTTLAQQKTITLSLDNGAAGGDTFFTGGSPNSTLTVMVNYSIIRFGA